MKSTIASALGVLATGFALSACGGDEATPTGAGDLSPTLPQGSEKVELRHRGKA